MSRGPFHATLCGGPGLSHRRTFLRFAAACGAILLTVSMSAQRSASPPPRQLLLVLDGLRPDYVTPEVMPNLWALAGRGVVFTDHHSIFPTVTRVHASSIVTGTYPERHGLLGNAVFFPLVDPSRFLDTGER